MSKRKLLLADDSITIQKVVNLTFADEGVEVISVGDGDSAMQKFDEFMPDLVMADVNMPGLTGYEICQIIKQNDDTRHIPVILLVGSFEPFDEAEASRVGADDFLTKPFQSIRQLVNKVNDLLTRSENVPQEVQSETEDIPQGDTFAKTLEFENKDELASEFGDAGMDDEMIETSPANNFVSDSNADYQAETSIDYAKTQPLSADELKGFSIVPSGDAAGQETEETTQDATEDQEPVEANFDETIPQMTEPESDFEESRKFEESQKFAESPTFEDSAVSEEYDAEVEREPESTSDSEELSYYSPADEEKPEVEAADDEEEKSEVETADFETFEPEVAPPETDETSDDETAEQEISEPTAFEDETIDPIEETEPQDLSESETIADPEIEKTEEDEIASADEAETVEAQESETPEAKTSEIEESESAETDLSETAETAEIPEAQPDSIEEEQISAPKNIPALNFDDGDLLELPPLVEETGIRPQPQVQQLKAETETEPVAETIAEPQPESEVETQSAESQPISQIENMQSFPPELIEAIAQKVAERISDKAIRDIAWEVVPQMTELIIKKMAEEKMKE